MFYLAIVSSSFRKSSLEELERIASFRIAEEFVNTLVIESEDEDLAGKLLKSGPVFVYNIFRLDGGKARIDDEDYLQSIYKALSKTIPRKGGVKIECFDVNCKTEYSAKDIEVYIGQRLEKEGCDVNITEPDYLAYIVLINGNCYAGISEYKGMDKKFVNPERHYHQSSKDAISRSELKLAQAFDEFGIKGSGIAIDLGSAPGGWSDFLARSGYKVIAIDNGNLDYAAFREKGIKVKILEGAKLSNDDIMDCDIIHIKSNAKDAATMLNWIKADLIVDDMNMEPAESSAILLLFSGNLAAKAELVMTIKCVDRKAEKYVSRAKKALAGFEIRGIRVLPSNRQELTLHAVYSG